MDGINALYLMYDAVKHNRARPSSTLKLYILIFGAKAFMITFIMCLAQFMLILSPDERSALNDSLAVLILNSLDVIGSKYFLVDVKIRFNKEFYSSNFLVFNFS